LKNALEPKTQERTTRERTAVMADQETGMKPDKEGGAGMEKTKPKAAEAGGRHRSHYTCWRRFALNHM
jgi:hypothetical protein